MQSEDPGGAAAQESVARIVYASESCIGGAVYAEMERIRASAVRHNVPAGIHTALLYQSGWFVQWKEGPGDALLKLVDRVAADPRHRGIRVVHSSRGPRLLSGPWSMAIVQAHEPPDAMAWRVTSLRRSMQLGVQSSPPAVWRRLSTPLDHPGAAQQADPDAFQRVLVCAAASSPSFALARWLAERHRQPLVHRRFAGDLGLDVGTDYVDFGDGDRVLRVIAMSRKGLALPLTRAFVPDYSHIVLLLCGEPERDLTLVDRVAAACAGLASPPVLLGVAQQRTAHAQPFALARRLGLVYLDACAGPDDCAAQWAAVHPLLAMGRQCTSSAPRPLQHAVTAQ